MDFEGHRLHRDDGGLHRARRVGGHGEKLLVIIAVIIAMNMPRSTGD